MAAGAGGVAGASVVGGATGLSAVVGGGVVGVAGDCADAGIIAIEAAARAIGTSKTSRVERDVIREISILSGFA